MISTGNTGRPFPLAIYLFGPFEVRRHGFPLPGVRFRKGHWLLALLTLRQGREIERAWLAGTLWPYSPHAQAMASLRNCLKDLRDTLGSEADRLYSPQTDTLALELSGAYADVLAFDGAIAQDDTAALEHAISLYRGPLLEECTEEWAFRERQIREQRYLAVLETLAARAMERRELAEAERYLRLTVAVEPFTETAQRALMDILAARGDNAAALQVYRDLRQRLQRELNVDPEPRTEELFRRIEAASPPSTARRQRANTVLGSSLELRRSVRPRSVLPTPPTPLVGREAELAALDALLQRESVRLVTLTGPGGSGKTRLGMQIAAGRLDHSQDGVFFVSLAPLRDPDLVISAIARTLEVNEKAGRSLLDCVQQAIRDKELLLLLDNFEHVAEAAPQVAQLLATSPRLKVLVTSRMLLRLYGEHEFPVSPLPLPHLGHQVPVEQLERCPSVKLFIQRAVAANPSFALADRNARAVAEICVRLDGLPLAIELAAARMKTLAPGQLLSLLAGPDLAAAVDRLAEEGRGRSLELLTRGARDMPARQQTLRATIAWSHDLLSPSEQTLFRRLAIFAGGFALEGVRSVCLLPGEHDLDPLEALTGLVEQSLVRPEPDLAGQPRFSMLETIREYAAERLSENGDDFTVQRQHILYFLSVAEAAEPHLSGSEAARWFDQLDVEYDNLRCALRRVLSAGEVTLSLRLGAAVGPYWRARGYRTEGQAHLRSILELAGTEGEDRLRARVLRISGMLAVRSGDWDLARTRLDAALSLCRACEDSLGVAWTQLWRGHLERSQVHPPAAQAAYDECRGICRERGDRLGEALVLNGLGLMGVEAGDWERARALLEESLAIAREIGDSECAATVLVNLGTMAWERRQELGVARAYYEEALARFRELGIRPSTAFTHSALAGVLVQQQEYAAAREHGTAALALYQELGDQHAIASRWADLAELEARLQNLPEAEALHRESLALFRRLGAPEAVALPLVRLADVVLRQSRPAEARPLYQEALSLRRGLLAETAPEAVSRRVFHRVQIAFCLIGLGKAAGATGQSGVARRLLGAAESIRESLGELPSLLSRERLRDEITAARTELANGNGGTAWAEGRALALEAAIDAALEIV